MRKLYVSLLTALFVLTFFLNIRAQQVFWGAAYFPNLVFSLTADTSQQLALPFLKGGQEQWGFGSLELMLGKDGNIYGLNEIDGGNMFFKITKDGLFSLHHFDYATIGPMIEVEQGNFYKFSSGANGDYVAVEKIRSDGSGYQSYGFHKGIFRPEGLMVSNGAIYGVNGAGANDGAGYIFKFTPTDDLKNFQVIFNFSPLTGRKPRGRLLDGPDGFLYGVTLTGGVNDDGAIYKVRSDGSQFTKLHDFNFASGRYPVTGLVSDGSGWLYGTTTQGGTNRKGVVYKIKTDGSGYAILHNFASSSNGPKGELRYFNNYVYGYEGGLTGEDAVPMSMYRFRTNDSTNSFSRFYYTFPPELQTAGTSLLIDPAPFVPNVYATTPVNNSTVSSKNTQFIFRPIQEAVLYTMELSLTNDFANLVGRIQTDKPEFIATDLKPDTKYYVRIKSNVWPTFGPVTSFTTAPSVVANNGISSPKDGATGVSAPSLKVTAGTITGATRYTIELSTSPDFITKFVRTSSVDNQRTLIFDSLSYATKYYGRFKTNISEYGRVTSFTTRPESFSVLQEPTNQTINVDPVVVHLLVAEVTGAKRYTIQLSTSASFTTTPLEVSSIEDHQTNFIIKNLKYATRYFVRIKSNINTTWSGTYSFTTRQVIAQKRLWGVTTFYGAYDAGTVFSYSIDSASFTRHFDYETTYEFDYGDHLQGSVIHGAKGTVYFHTSSPNSTSYGGSLYTISPQGEINWIAESGMDDGNLTLTANNFIYFTVNRFFTGGTIDRYGLHSGRHDRIFNFYGTTKGVDPGSELLELQDGYLYGRANSGGIKQRGTLYRLRYDGTGFEVIHFFDQVNGSNPTGNLVVADDGYLYGTTAIGGAFGHGTIYKIRPDGSRFTKLFDFTGVNGSKPYGGVIVKGRILYGTTSEGGTNNNNGTVFKLRTDGSGFVNLHSFSGNNGSKPVAKLTLSNTTLYGMTYLGGTHAKGVIFKIETDGSQFAELYHFDSTSGGHPDGYLTLKEDTFIPSARPASMIAENPIVNVVPNPSATDFSLTFDSQHTHAVQITVADMNGHVVHKSMASSTESVRIGDSLDRGIYILKVKQGNRTTMHRLVKK
jgi:uncharacterized repeat protein (TIGR03803 family)